MTKLNIFKEVALCLVFLFTFLSNLLLADGPFGIPDSQTGSSSTLDIQEEQDHYLIKAVRGSYEYWQIKVDKLSGAIYSFQELDSDNQEDYLGTDGYGRKVSLLHFKGRGGAVFSRRYQITDHPIRFEISPDSTSFEIIYEELSSQAENFFQIGRAHV